MREFLVVGRLALYAAMSSIDSSSGGTTAVSDQRAGRKALATNEGAGHGSVVANYPTQSATLSMLKESNIPVTTVCAPMRTSPWREWDVLMRLTSQAPRLPLPYRRDELYQRAEN